MVRIEVSNQLRHKGQRRANKSEQGEDGKQHPNKTEIRPAAKPSHDSRKTERNDGQ
jgi:hypothetical protein